MKLTVWEITPPCESYKESDIVYRWTIEHRSIFITSTHEFQTEIAAENSLVKFVRHKFPDYTAKLVGYINIIYDERTNLEFLA